ncbi:MAG: response regulator [Deltaproteobacteria bacterium]|nr:response regulator [Deltaproteobacteria bacterium]
MAPKKKFSRFLILTLVAFEGISLTLVLGILYGILSRSLTGEFQNHLRAQEVEVTGILHDRLNHVERRIREMSLNNALRVNLMLDVKSQLLETMETQYPASDGAFFFLTYMGHQGLTPLLPENLNGLEPYLLKMAQGEHIRGLRFLRNPGNGRFLALFSLPLMRKHERLGTAHAVYDLTMDTRLWERLLSPPVSLFLRDRSTLTDLRTGLTRPMPGAAVEQDTKAEDRLRPDLLHDETYIPIREFPGLYFWTSSLPLKEKKDSLALIFAVLFAGVLTLTLVVSRYIARRVSDPLEGIARQALLISGNPSGIFLQEENIRYLEFQQLTHAFNELLEALRSAHKKLERSAKKALYDSEERYRKTLEAAPDAITISRLGDGRFLQVNEAFCRITGFSREEALEKTITELGFLGDDSTGESLDRALKEKSDLNGLEVSFRRKNGALFQALFSSRRIRLGRDECVVAVATDITALKKAEVENKRLEDQLRQSQKMEAVGTLAGGIAHDFNNLLQAVGGYSDLLLLDKKRGETGYRELKEIKSAANRASELTQQLLTFSRRVKSKLRPVDLNRELKQVHKLLSRIIPKMIEIDLRLAEDLSIISADPAQIEQVMLNLGVNARDAMPEGGRLVIETKNVTLDEDFCRLNLGARPGEYVLLSASDNGLGMDEETLQHIFEPFYTTKRMGRGTGLGLAMVYGIVKNHDGYIACESKPKRGTTFAIYLPALAKEAEQEAEAEEGISKGGMEMILLVDDEQPIRALGEKILARFGYRVLTAPDGETALELLLHGHVPVDLIILDLIMPGMGGVRFLREIRKTHPQVKIVVASGYSGDGLRQEAFGAGAEAFITKPYEAKKILRTVREVLDGKN